MKHSIKTGLGFGITSGVITTIGLIVGLGTSTGSKLVIIGGVLTIAVADALSDAMGIHVSEESKNSKKIKEIWEATIATFVSKFFFAITFMVPILIFSVNTAIIVSIIWGLVLLGTFSYITARIQKIKAWKIVLEHTLLTIFVIIATYFVGVFVRSVFG
ncbi:MAG: hypothetical protein HQ536_00725 [Parcubacteria group bacterium]|nr:hypothetical protein [Parcubacteria group bacterium]